MCEESSEFDAERIETERRAHQRAKARLNQKLREKILEYNRAKAREHNLERALVLAPADEGGEGDE